MEGVIKHDKLTLSVPEAAKLIGVSASKMYEIVRIQGFPAIRVGKRVLVNAKKLEAWLDEMTEKGWYLQGNLWRFRVCRV